MVSGWAAWPFAALYFPALQVLPLYIWHHLPRSQTIVRRMLVTTAVAGAAGWLPTARRLTAAAGGKAPSAATLLSALGVRAAGLTEACTLPLLLTALLFAGPLAQLWLGRGNAGGSQPLRRHQPAPLAARLRNWVAAPLVEEFIFRACMLSYLLASGAAPGTCILLSPLPFAASHLHHLYDLTRFQGYRFPDAARAVAFQFAYTAAFGWLAAFFFERTRHLAAAVLPHAFCNIMGPPALPTPGTPHRNAILAAYAAGVAAFLWLLDSATNPALYYAPYA